MNVTSSSKYSVEWRKGDRERWRFAMSDDPRYVVDFTAEDVETVLTNMEHLP